MASNSTTMSSPTGLPDVIPPPPPGLNYVAAIGPSLNLIIIGTVWTSFLVPITIALFFFSTAHTRRQPVFILNVIALGIGLLEGAINIYNQTRAILAKPVNMNFSTTFACMSILAPMFAESILLFRVYAVYPPRRLSVRHRIAVYLPIAILKVARLANDAVFAAVHTPYMKIEWFLQLADNTFTSTLFLLKLRKGLDHRDDVVYTSQSSSKRSYSHRLKTLFWIAVSNFVFPILLSLAQLVLVFVVDSLLDGTYIFMVNNYVEIIGVLLATVWSSANERSAGGDASDPGALSSIVRFASTGQSTSLSSRDEEFRHMGEGKTEGPGERDAGFATLWQEDRTRK